MGRGGRKKFVCVGDEQSGKSTLIKVFGGAAFQEIYTPTVSESFLLEKTTLVYDEDGGQQRNVMSMEICDTTGSEELDRLRPLSYDNADLWMVCFSVDNRQSLINVIEKWVPEVKYFHPNIPLVLIGCKNDLREDPDTLDRLGRLGESPVSIEEAQEVAREIGAFKYVETSAKTGYQVDNLFDDDVDDSGEDVVEEEREEDEEGQEEDDLAAEEADGDEEREEQAPELEAVEELDEPVANEQALPQVDPTPTASSQDFVTANSTFTSGLSSSSTPSSSSSSTNSAAEVVAAPAMPTSLSSDTLHSEFSPHAHHETKQQYHRISRIVSPTGSPRLSLDEYPALPTHAPLATSPAAGGARKVAVTAKGVVVLTANGKDSVPSGMHLGPPGRKNKKRHHNRRASTASSISTLSTSSSSSSLSTMSTASAVEEVKDALAGTGPVERSDATEDDLTSEVSDVAMPLDERPPIPPAAPVAPLIEGTVPPTANIESTIQLENLLEEAKEPAVESLPSEPSQEGFLIAAEPTVRPDSTSPLLPAEPSLMESIATASDAVPPIPEKVAAAAADNLPTSPPETSETVNAPKSNVPVAPAKQPAASKAPYPLYSDDDTLKPGMLRVDVVDDARRKAPPVPPPGKEGCCTIL
ncbi:GTP-binding protein Rho1 [Phlyctochytrium planicorne]|nr:GTP-binding protein Rho1 [Phlyctochytrium planicorne]